MATTLIASVTNLGAQREARSLETGKSFRITHFELGSEGHDPDDPLSALTPDASLTETPGRVFGPEPVDSVDYISLTCPFWTCLVGNAEANGSAISSVTLIATIIHNGNDPVDEEGVTFPYAIANFPRVPKTVADEWTLEIGIQA